MEQIINAIKLLASTCDGAQRKDMCGFNAYDSNYVHNYLLCKSTWTDLDAYNAWKLLHKYRNQLLNLGIDYNSLQIPQLKIKITPTFSETWENLNMILEGRISKQDFSKYLEIHKKHGFSFNGKNWYLKQIKISNFNFKQYCEEMKTLDIEVDELPKKSIQSSLNVHDAIEGIRNRRIKDCLVIYYFKGLFSFYFPFHPRAIELFSNRSGILSGITEFNPVEKTRETRDIETVLEVLDKIKDILPDWQVVTKGVDEAIAQRNEQLIRDQVPIKEVAQILNPEIRLYPFQNEGIRWLISQNGNALLGLEMGLGKTPISLAYAASQQKRVLAVVPKTVRRTWIQEAEKFFPSYFCGKMLELRSKVLKSGQPDLKNIRLATVNYAMLEKFLPAILDAGFDTLIVDESHKIKNPKAKITKLIYQLQDQFKHKILLSGTAIKNKKEELLTQTNFIQPNLFNKQELQYGTIGGCWNKLKASIYFSKTKKDVLKDLPEKINQIIELEVKGMPLLPENIGEMSKARVQAALAKTKATIEFTEEILDSSDSCCLIFSESIEAAKKIAEKLGDVAILHHGQMGDEKREKAKQEFQNEKSSKRVFVTTRQSVEVGVTLTRADKVIFNDLPWCSTDVAQAEARAHRIGTKNVVNIYWITATNSDWDKNLSDIIRRKFEITKKINEGKQVSQDEQKWLYAAITFAEIKKGIITK